MALAGGISIILSDQVGYLYEKDGILSPEGTCKPFSSEAAGTVPSSGAGIVVLKRFQDAIRDGDNIDAVISGHAINNDGNDKMGFTAPSISGQANCIRKALALANLSPEEISHVEAHGTGTSLGDPIEVKALIEAYQTGRKQYCAISSVKANIGHTQSASGVAGLIKTVLMLKNKTIPAALYCDEPNKIINFLDSPFYINTKSINLNSQSEPILAAVSSFGLGGTNAHVVLKSHQNYPAKIGSANPYNLIVLSAQSEPALKILSNNLRNFLINKLKLNSLKNSFLDDVSFTLQTGRTDLKIRRAWICEDITDAITKLANADKEIIYDNINNNEYLKLYNIALCWINKQGIDWQSLHTTQRNRIRLPGYPLQRKIFEASIQNSSDNNLQNIKVISKTPNITECLKEIFSEALGHNNIDILADFFTLGGDSLSGLNILFKIEAKLAACVSLDDLFTLRNIKSLAKHINNMLLSHPTNIKITKIKSANNDCKTPFFVIHPGHGSLYSYDKFIECIEGDRSVYGIENNLLNDISYKFDTIEKMAAHYLKLIKTLQPTGPYMLSGWSFGGVVSFEIARQLEARGEMAKIFLYDAWAKQSLRFNDKDFIRTIYKDTDNNFCEKDTWYFLLWHRIQLLLRYTPKTINAEITLFKAITLKEEYEDVNDPTNHWQPLTSKSIQVFQIPGCHLSIMESPNVEK